jgi:hypothetical protein
LFYENAFMQFAVENSHLMKPKSVALAFKR